MQRPFVSVLMPVYNAEKFLSRSIQSILQQSYTDFEFIIINDGSTDRSEEIILSFKDERIRYYKNEQNLKLIKTLNKGIALTAGSYVARMDSDDEAMPERLEKQINFMESHPELAASGTYAYRLNEQGEKGEWKYPTSKEAMKCRLFWGNTIIHPTAMVKREVLLKYAFKEDYPDAEDYKLWKDVALDYELANLPEFLLNYHEHSAQITQQKKTQMNETSLKINEEWLQKLGLKVPSTLREAYSAFFLYDYSHWSNKQIEELSDFLVQVDSKNKSIKLFKQDLFSYELALRLKFVVMNTVKQAPKGHIYYKKGGFDKAVPLTLRDTIKLVTKKLF